ncbi:MAG: VOC family protein, partial [Rhodospirillaceae bacterium]|nr:VOC family protein [Rhodospirillaceae bacterium]
PEMPGTGTIHLPKRARDVRQIEAVGNQPAGRAFLFPTADDFRLDCRTNAMLGFRFQEGPRHEEYGAVAVFTDKHCDKWDIIEPN